MRSAGRNNKEFPKFACRLGLWRNLSLETGIRMRDLLVDNRAMLVTIAFAGTLLCIPGVRATSSTEVPPVVVSAASKQQPAQGDRFDLAKLQAGARVVYVSSGTKAFALRAIDGDPRTTFRFSSADLRPTVIIELAQNQPLYRVSVVYESGEGHVDIYLLAELAKDPSDLRNAKPLTSIVDLANDGEAAVNFEPSNARYVALRWTRHDKSGNRRLDIAEISAFSTSPAGQFSAIPTGDPPGDPLAGPPVIASVSP